MISTSSISEEEIVTIRNEILKNTGINLKNFKTPFLGRRIMNRMLIKGLNQCSEYAQLLSEDPMEASTLYQSFSINVTEFFRNPKVWQGFAKDIIPEIINTKQSGKSIRIWSAGCATGQEPYSLAILFRKFCGKNPPKINVIGTDMNKIAVNIAKTGIYDKKSLKNIPDIEITKYFQKIDDELYKIKDEIKNLVEYNISDVGSLSIRNLDVIVCRNLLIYYGKEAQELLFKKFYDSLCKNGFVILGMDETMIGTIGTKLFKAIHPRERIFKKLIR